MECSKKNSGVFSVMEAEDLLPEGKKSGSGYPGSSQRYKAIVIFTHHVLLNLSGRFLLTAFL